YLTRFQLIAGALLSIILPICCFLFPSMFFGLFDALGFWSFVCVTWGAVQLAWTVIITWRLVTVYGPDRFPGITGMKGRDDLPWSTWGLFALPALPCILVTGFGTHQLSSARIVLGIVVGILLATAVLWITARIHFFIEPESGRSALTVFPGLGFLRPQPDNSRSAAARLLDRMLASIIPHPLVGGLMKPDPDDPTRLRLRSGHQLAGTVVAVLL